MSSQDMFPSDPDDLIGTPIESSGISAASALSVLSATNDAEVFDPSPSLVPAVRRKEYHCEVCKKILKTDRGFLSHRVLHQINDVNSRKPSLTKLVEDVVAHHCGEIIDEISAEPILEENGMKRQKLYEVIRLKLHSPNFCYFVNAASSSISGILVKRTKVFPSNQLDDSICQFNALINEPGFMSDLRERLSFALSESTEKDFDNHMLTRFIFLFCHKIFFRLQKIVLQEMKMSCISGKSDEGPDSSISKAETSAYLSSMACLLRAQFKRNLASSHTVSSHFCSCLKRMFVMSTFDEISDKCFLNHKFWGDVGSNSKIQISVNAAKFFVGIENIIRKEAAATNNDSLLDALLGLQYEDIFNVWSSLTSQHLNEADSLKYLKDFLASILNISSNAEAARQMRVFQQEQRQQKFALRTGLKRN